LLARGTRADPLSRLTPREQDVLDAMAEGLTNAGIGERLRMSVSAVEKHVASIFGKLGIPETAGYSRRVLAVLRYLGS
jgi:DNA-binding NarL/FixJ family response regulator